MKLTTIFTTLSALCLAIASFAQTNIPSQSVLIENFNSLGTTATVSFPANWKVSSARIGNTSGCALGTNLTSAIWSAHPNTFVKIYGNKHLLPYQQQFTSNEQIVIQTVASKSCYKPDNFIHYGIGIRLGQAVAHFSNNVDSIVINTPTDEAVLSDKAIIKQFFLRPKKWLWKNPLYDRG